ncbi:hypothetical protein C2845_PM13G07090 [Panicum miliaceum]|uniref:Uncharacterized protein n=1 Tax=Panicum miliaceum TaxID=4540 RepID=A0A3L6RGZ7_PANMI|nr:hypothetical protein C2845_PM13G07090 [Panicum miliaceum]
MSTFTAVALPTPWFCHAGPTGGPHSLPPSRVPPSVPNRKHCSSGPPIPTSASRSGAAEAGRCCSRGGRRRSKPRAEQVPRHRVPCSWTWGLLRKHGVLRKHGGREEPRRGRAGAAVALRLGRPVGRAAWVRPAVGAEPGARGARRRCGRPPSPGRIRGRRSAGARAGTSGAGWGAAGPVVVPMTQEVMAVDPNGKDNATVEQPITPLLLVAPPAPAFCRV